MGVRDTHKRALERYRYGKMGAASDVRVIDPATGTQVGTVKDPKWKRIRRRKKERRKAEAKPPKNARVKGNVMIMGFNGTPCPRCKKPMQVREHVAITEKLLRQPSYLMRWYCCMNHKCRTTLVTPEEHRVYTDSQVLWRSTWGDVDAQGGADPGRELARALYGGDR